MTTKSKSPSAKSVSAAARKSSPVIDQVRAQQAARRGHVAGGALTPDLTSTTLPSGIAHQVNPLIPPDEMPIDRIRPKHNPRKFFDPVKLEELAQSIRQQGVLQPLLVRPDGELIVGERRLRAAKLAGLKSVPVRIVEKTDLQTAAARMEENLHRDDLNVVEEALGYQDMLDRFPDELNQRKVAVLFSRSESHVSNRLRLLKLPDVWLQRLAAKQITDHHAWELLKFVSRPAVLAEANSDWQAASQETDFVPWSIDELRSTLRSAVYLHSRSMSKPNCRFKADAATRQQLDIEEIGFGGWEGKHERAWNVQLWDQLQQAAEKQLQKRQTQAAAKPAKAHEVSGLEKHKVEQLWEHWFARRIVAALSGKLPKPKRELAWKLVLITLSDDTIGSLMKFWTKKTFAYSDTPDAIRLILGKPVGEIEDALIGSFLDRLRQKALYLFPDLQEWQAAAAGLGITLEAWEPDREFLEAIPAGLLTELAQEQSIQVEKSAKKQIDKLLELWQPGFIPDVLDAFPKPDPQPTKTKKSKAAAK